MLPHLKGAKNVKYNNRWCKKEWDKLFLYFCQSLESPADNTIPHPAKPVMVDGDWDCSSVGCVFGSMVDQLFSINLEFLFSFLNSHHHDLISFCALHPDQASFDNRIRMLAKWSEASSLTPFVLLLFLLSHLQRVLQRLLTFCARLGFQTAKNLYMSKKANF